MQNAQSTKITPHPQLSETPAKTANDELLQHVEKLKRRQQSILFPLTASAEDVETLATYKRRQHEAIDNALDVRNRALKAMADAEASFVTELSNSLLLRDRTTLVVDASDHYHSEKLRLQESIERNSKAYYNLIERKIAEAADRPAPIRNFIEAEIARDLQHWGTAVEQILNDYAALLTDKV